MNSLTDRLRVAALPLDIRWGDKDTNLAAVEAAIPSLPASTDLVVLPELFSTGFADDSDAIAAMAETNTGTTIERVRQWASASGCAFAGSFLAKSGHAYYNRGFFIEPSGEETFYDKRHLFSLSSEAKVFHRGEELPKIVRFRGWNIATIVCYDLRFPAWCRCRGGNYDLLLVPANWPRARAYAWEHLLIARAIENQCAVVGANRGGKDVYGDYEGLTKIYDCRGYGMPPLEGCGPFVCSDLSRRKQDEFRKAFPAGADADDFDIS